MRADLRALLWRALLALLALCVVPLAHAGGEKEVVVAKEVTVRVRWPWPDMLNHGAQPIFVEVENGGADEHVVDFTLSTYSGFETCTIEKSVRVGSGERSAFEVCAPVPSEGASPYHVVIRCAGETERVPSAGATMPAEYGVRNVLVLSAAPLDPGMPATWTKRLSKLASSAWGQPLPAAVYPGVRRIGYVGSYPGAPTTSDLVRVSPVLFADLPMNAACYSSIDAVVIDTSAGLPDSDALAALAAFARTGGVVVFGGAHAREAARGAPDFAAWVEPRFRLGSSTQTLDAYVSGQGLLAVSAMEVWSLEPFDARIMHLLEAQNGHVSCIPRRGGGRGHDIDVTLPGLELPYRSLMLVLLVFAIVIGPLNLWFVKRSKKPVLLLFTVPAIAIVFSLALFAYGALAQGLDVRARSVTLTLLDQRLHRSTTLETREIFAGLAPKSGLRPGPGAWAYWNPSAASWRERKTYLIGLDDGVEFGGDYMPARTPTRQSLITDRAARQRVELRREGDGWTAQLALGADVRHFVFRAPDGRVWKAPGASADGDSVKLVLVEDPAGEVIIPPPKNPVPVGVTQRILAVEVKDAAQGLPIGSYFALLETSPFTDAMGIEADAVESVHHVVGIVDLAEVNR